jgi:magnesium chelatase family protein
MSDPERSRSALSHSPDLADVRGQESAKRALEIAAAGGHPILLTGPRGSGKTLLGGCLPGLLPAFPQDETDTAQATCPPFRAPHPCSRPAALSGHQQPGEADLARGGVLFLDDLPAFGLRSLRLLRKLLEDNGRPGPGTAPAPLPFLFAAAMRPCPCSYLGEPDHECTCPPWKLDRYWSGVGDLLLDLFHLHTELVPVSLSEFHRRSGETSQQVAGRVLATRTRQRERHGCGLLNAHLPARALPEVCKPNPAGQRLLDHAYERLKLSVRATGILLRVARTVADLGGSDDIRPPHVAEAIQLRPHSWFGDTPG